MGNFRGDTYSKPISVPAKPGPFSRLTESVQRTEELEKRAAELEIKAGIQNTWNDATNKSIESLKQEISKWPNQLATEIANTKNGLEARFDLQVKGLEQRIERIEGRLGEHEKRIACLERGHSSGVSTKKP